MEHIELTTKEIGFIKLLCRQFSLAAIAGMLQQSPVEIETLQLKIQKKIGAKNEVGIAFYAMKHGIVHF